MFTSADCQLFGRYASAVRFNTASDADKEQFRRIRNEIKSEFAAAAGSTSFAAVDFTSGVSSLSPNGNTPKIIWGCAYPSSVPNKSYALQVAFILSEKGGELCCCLGSGDSQQKDADLKKVCERAFSQMKTRLAAVPEQVASEVANGFKREWTFRKKWERQGSAAEFSNLNQWLRFASGPDGNGASISFFYTPSEIEEGKLVLGDDLREALATFAPLFRFVYLEEYEESESPESVAYSNEYTIEQFAAETGFDHPTISAWVETTARKGQIIFQGPPGTGKTFVAERLAKHLVSGQRGFVELLQFHPSYTYEEFIQGLRPQIVDGQIHFAMVPGRFLDFCDRARKLPATVPCVLILDEFNRANLSRVFGELMYLLEYRDRMVPLAGDGRPFQIPQNVRIIGTMNTADRSIALVDHALRRRFSFVTLSPQYEILRAHLIRSELPADSLIDALQSVNRTIGDPHYELGTSFFMQDPTTLRRRLPQIWRGEIEPYLQEYFYDQPEKVEMLRWEKFSTSELSEWLTQ